ncbi:hypothetical protein DV113_001262 [Geotrichum candidum]|nr:hypothetical protein DV452_003889 [Geotrichum candidum]KAF7500743.1 hypothetical protein DV113_001262 [Geotrichum candidum]KAI9214814.1 hypothetical protein DS838_000313 [Geotrichum bryndzae]
MADASTRKIKNKAVAQLQISAEQILLEAFERKEEPLKVPLQKFTDLEELYEYQGRKRREYEDALRRNRQDYGQWMRYAQWEFDQQEFARARSIFERALDVDSQNIPLWIRYIQSELKTRNINHARNLLDRAVTILPRVDKLWFNYVAVEETLLNIDGCREVFERWMRWNPPAAAWTAYINMEKRYNEIENARAIFQRFTAVHPEPENWIKWAKFEQEFGTPDNVREVYTIAIDSLTVIDEQYLNGADTSALDEKLLISFAKWESQEQEWERARAIYKFGLEHLSKSKSMNLYNAYTAFEKQYGDKDGIEDVILAKRRVKYEDEVKANPYDYDSWFSYLTLVEEASSSPDEIRDVYERAIANVPQISEKRYWRRYIFLWIRYAIYEELETQDIERAREVYKQCIKLIPHKKFSFDKIWLLYAKFEIRHGTLSTARKILGRAIALSGKPKLFKGYIALESELKEFDRCRKLYEKYIENYPELPQPWIEFAELEQMLGDVDRARAIFELAIAQQEMEMPELVWKRYIEFETEEEEYERARNLYEILVEKTGHVKVWISYAMFELQVPDENAPPPENEEDEEIELEVTDEAKIKARAVFQRAWDYFKANGKKEEFEQVHGTADDQAKVAKQQPYTVTKTKKLPDGSLQEYLDYVFPTDESDRTFTSFLENARKWKEMQAKQSQQA